MRRLLLTFVLAAVVGAVLYALRPKPGGQKIGHLGDDGYRRDLFRGVLPPVDLPEILRREER